MSSKHRSERQSNSVNTWSTHHSIERLNTVAALAAAEEKMFTCVENSQHCQPQPDERKLSKDHSPAQERRIVTLEPKQKLVTTISWRSISTRSPDTQHHRVCTLRLFLARGVEVRLCPPVRSNLPHCGVCLWGKESIEAEPGKQYVFTYPTDVSLDATWIDASKRRWDFGSRSDKAETIAPDSTLCILHEESLWCTKCSSFRGEGGKGGGKTGKCKRTFWK